MTTDATTTREAIDTQAFDTEAAAKARAKARDALDSTKAQRAHLEARLSQARAAAEAAEDGSSKVAFAASQGNSQSKAALERHTIAKRKAEDEATNLAYAVKEATARVEAAEAAARLAEDSNTLSQAAAIISNELLPLAGRIDAAAAAFVAMFQERQEMLNRLRDLGALEGQTWLGARVSERRFASLFAISPGFAEMAEGAPGLRAWVHRFSDHAKPLAENDAALAHAVLRMDHVVVTAPKAEAPPTETAPPAAPAPLDEEEGGGINYNPATGARIRRPQGEEAPTQTPSGARIIRR